MDFIGLATSRILEVARKTRSLPFKTLNPCSDLNQFLVDLFDDFLPPDAHVQATGRVHVSLAKIIKVSEEEDPDEYFQGEKQTGFRYIVSHFRTRDELIKVTHGLSFVSV